MEIFAALAAKAFSPQTLSLLLLLLGAALFLAIAITFALVSFGAITSNLTAQIFVLLLGLGILGSVSGYTGGISREAAVASIIPAVLAIAGGLSAYLFGIDRSRGAIASIAIVAFTLALLFGFAFGASVRSDIDRNDPLREACFKLFFDPATYATTESANLALGSGLGPSCQLFFSNTTPR